MSSSRLNPLNPVFSGLVYFLVNPERSLKKDQRRKRRKSQFTNSQFVQGQNPLEIVIIVIVATLV
jgi:hypothetical protein